MQTNLHDTSITEKKCYILCSVLTTDMRVCIKPLLCPLKIRFHTTTTVNKQNIRGEAA